MILRVTSQKEILSEDGSILTIVATIRPVFELEAILWRIEKGKA